jgi:hypothetical protein
MKRKYTQPKTSASCSSGGFALSLGPNDTSDQVEGSGDGRGM